MAPSVDHMLFADNSFLYCKATVSQAEHVLRLLQIFERASGQKVNLDKSFMFFSSNIIQSNKQQLCQTLNMKEADKDCKYLGLPNFMQRSKIATLGYLRGKVKKRVQSWEGSLISQGGKEVLIKSVAQALPTYAMSVFLLPIEIHQDIERSISKFWWNSKNDGKKGIHWMS